MKLYVPDTSNHRIVSYLHSGIRTTFAGDGTLGFGIDNAPATASSLYGPRKTWQDSVGNIYIADSNQRVFKVDTNGIRRGFVARVNSFMYFAVAGDTEYLYILHGPLLLSASLSATSTFPDPSFIIAGMGSNQLLNVGDENIGSEISFGSTSDTFDMWIDSTYNKFITTSSSRKVYQLGPGSSTNLSVRLIAILPSATGSISSITGDSNDYLYVGTVSAIYRIDRNSNNAVTKIMGAAGLGYTPDGQTVSDSTPVRFPTGLTMDSESNLYFIDDNQIIRKIDMSTNKISTIVGEYNSNIVFSTQVNPLIGSLDSPRGVMWDRDGNLVICESDARIVHKIIYS